jgi:predicted NBD/HSP70 family sugar kinase
VARLQDVVSLSALLKKIGEAGHRRDGIDVLSHPSQEIAALVAEWVELAADLLAEPLAHLSCVIDPAALLIGGRLPNWIIDDLVEALSRGLSQTTTLSAPTRVLRAATANDGPAIGAAILPFIDQFLPSRATLMTTGESWSR